MKITIEIPEDMLPHFAAIQESLRSAAAIALMRRGIEYQGISDELKKLEKDLGL